MLRMVLDDFRWNFKDGVKRAFGKMESWYLVFYMAVFPPIYLQADKRGFFVYYFSFSPMLLALLISRVYGGWMEKTLFLCPLTKKEREKYYLISWGIRTGTPVFLFLLLGGGLIAVNWLHPLAFAAMFILLLFYSATVNMYCGGTADKGRAAGQKPPVSASFEAWNVVGQIFGLFAMLVLVAVVGDVEEPEVTTFETIVVSIFLVLNILIPIRILKEFRPVMEYVTEYEQSARYEPRKHGGQE